MMYMASEYFGMRISIGADVSRSTVYTVISVNQANVTELHVLLRGGWGYSATSINATLDAWSCAGRSMINENSEKAT